MVVEQDALGLQQLSLKLISTCIITKYGKIHYSTLIRVVESCTMVLIQHIILIALNFLDQCTPVAVPNLKHTIHVGNALKSVVLSDPG